MVLFSQLRADTGARILFPSAKDTERDVITIIGKQEAIDSAKEELLKIIKDLVRFCHLLYSYSNVVHRTLLMFHELL